MLLGQGSRFQPVSWMSRMLGIGPRFQTTLSQLLHLGYKCRIRLPLLVSAGFLLCHIFSVYVPVVEINVEVVEEEEEEVDAEEEIVEADIDAESAED